jgi:hypothetical protein
MSKTFEKAVTGFNHNIKHKGKVYHVQTEDSGINNPHIITHLFVGGNILASKKSSYGEVLSSPNVPEVVREMMEEQHKGMLRNLINGTYDNIDGASRHYQPGQLATAEESAKAQAAAAGSSARLGTKTLSNSLPPEVIAARELKETPKIVNENVETIFGEDLISEKSLDEVILSYLASEGEST